MDAQRVAVQGEPDHEHAKQAQQKRNEHHGRQAAVRAEHHRVNRRGHHARDEERDGRIDERHNAKDRAEAGAALRILDGVAQNKVANNQQHQNEVRGKARLPHPPYAPLKAGPQITGDHGGDDKHQRNLRSSLRTKVVFAVLGHQEPHAVIRHKEHDRKRRDRHRHVQIEDLLAQQQLGGDNLPRDHGGLGQNRALHQRRQGKGPCDVDRGEQRTKYQQYWDEPICL